MKERCPFCLLPHDPIIFAQDTCFYAIYNRAPILPGHVLLIPKRHVRQFDELNGKELSSIMVFSKQVMVALRKAFFPDGFDLTIQDGFVAGQTIDHFHLHIIARYKNDFADPGDWYPKLKSTETELIDSFNRAQYSSDELVEIAQYLKTLFYS